MQAEPLLLLAVTLQLRTARYAMYSRADVQTVSTAVGKGLDLRRAADGNLPRPKRIQARSASECVNPGIHSLALRACIGKKLSAARLIGIKTKSAYVMAADRTVVMQVWLRWDFRHGRLSADGRCDRARSGWDRYRADGKLSPLARMDAPDRSLDRPHICRCSRGPCLP